MAYYVEVATASLFLQVIVLVLLMGGYGLKRLKRFRQHGFAMLAAVVLHMVSILTVMIPSFVISIPFISRNITGLFEFAILIHTITGVLAVVLGTWLVASWRLRQSMQSCFSKKKVMRVTLTVWLIALIIGILLYLSAYTTLLS